MNGSTEFKALNADLSRDLSLLKEALFSSYPLPPVDLHGKALQDWWGNAYAMAPLGTRQYYERRDSLGRLLLEVLQMRLYGPLQDEVLFAQVVAMLATPDGRSEFQAQAKREDYNIETLHGAVAAANDTPRSVEPLFRSTPEELDDLQRACSSATPQEVADLFGHLQRNGDKQMIEELCEIAGEVGLKIFSFGWGFVINSPSTKVVFVNRLMNDKTPGLRQRLYNDWMIYSVHESLLPYLVDRENLDCDGLNVELVTDDASTLLLQFEIYGREGATEVIDRWFTDVYVPDLLPAQVSRALDPGFDYPMNVFFG